MTSKVFTVAHLPEALIHAWLQHLRDFDSYHPGCHFEVAADAPPTISLPEMIKILQLSPALTFSDIFERRKGDDIAASSSAQAVALLYESLPEAAQLALAQLLVAAWREAHG